MRPDLEILTKLVDDVWEIIFGTPRRPEGKLERLYGDYVKTKEMYTTTKKPKRARGNKGRYLADDPTTKDVNEAWVGGKRPMSKNK
jgi:hypothetical protein